METSQAAGGGGASQQADATTGTEQKTTSKGRRHKPTIPQRRKKALNDGGAAIKDEGDDTFEDLLRAAQEPANWERGQGRGRGQGSRAAAPQQIVFGGRASGFGAAKASRADASVSGRTSVQGKGGASGGAAQRVEGLHASLKTQGSQPTSPAAGKLRRATGEHVFEEKRENPETGDEKVEVDALDFEGYYPTVLPLRPPGAAPEPERQGSLAEVLPTDLLNDQETKEGVDVAEALGALAINATDAQGPRNILLQLPCLLPAPAVEIKVEPQDRRRSKGATEPQLQQQPALSLKALQAGKLGNLLVFQSGAVKMQLGEVLMDVASATESQCLQQAAIINVASGNCVFLGDVSHRAVCSPDMAQLLSDQPIPEWPRKLQAANGVVKGEGIANGDDVMLIEGPEIAQQMQGKHGSGRKKLMHKVDSDNEDDEDMQQAL